VEIYEFDKENKEEPPYLRAIALLGRDTPAVMGTRIPALFSLVTGGVVNTVDEEHHISTFTRKVSAEEFKTLSSGGQETQEDTAMGGKSEGSQNAEELLAKLEESEKKIAAFKAENEELKNTGKKQEAEAFFSKLRDEGKLPPALFDRAVALDARLAEEEDRKEVRAMFSALEAKVDLSGAHRADKKNAPAPAASSADLTAKIRAFQKEKKLASFADAAAALYAEKPELFEEEESHD
jgi:vacuolar-type H+-ATPase subunit I/STV1